MSTEPAARGASEAGAAEAAAYELAPGPSHAELVDRQRRWGGWYALLANLGAFRTYWWSMLIVGIGSPAIYLLAFGGGLALLIAANGVDVDGVGYLTFVGPALLLNAVFQTAFEEGSMPVFGGFKWRGNYFAAANTGISPAQQVLGVVGFALVRTIPAAAVFLGILALGGAVPSWGGLWLVPVSVLTALAVCLPTMAFAASIRDDRGQWNMLNRFVVMPLMLFSGTYYPLEVLPGAMQWIGWLSPLWHAVDLGRIAVYGLERPWWYPIVHVGVLLCFAAVGWRLARGAFTRRLAT